jgi:hypothetical protein
VNASRLQPAIRGTLGIAAAGAVLAGLLAFRPEDAPAAPKASIGAPGHVEDTVAAASRRAALEASVAHDPFRRNRLAPAKAYDGVQIEAARSAPPPAPIVRPVLILSGILWGAEPEALVDGIPGSDGSRLMHRGDSVAGIRLRSLTRDHVVLAGMDTTWTLFIRKPGT